VGPRAGLDVCEKSHPHRDINYIYIYIYTYIHVSTALEVLASYSEGFRITHRQATSGRIPLDE
jgi:hypothetical protein